MTCRNRPGRGPWPARPHPAAESAGNIARARSGRRSMSDGGGSPSRPRARLAALRPSMLRISLEKARHPGPAQVRAGVRIGAGLASEPPRHVTLIVGAPRLDRVSFGSDRPPPATKATDQVAQIGAGHAGSLRATQRPGCRCRGWPASLGGGASAWRGVTPFCAAVTMNPVLGAPWWTRTTDPQLRRLLLYPTELRAPVPETNSAVSASRSQCVQLVSRVYLKLSEYDFGFCTRGGMISIS